MPGLPIPDYHPIQTWEEHCLQLPAGLQWRAIVTGMISNLRWGYTWDRNTGDTDHAKGLGAEILWRWLDHGGCPDNLCAEILEVAQNSADLQTFVVNLLVKLVESCVKQALEEVIPEV